MNIRFATSKDARSLVELAKERDSDINKGPRPSYWREKFKGLIRAKRVLVAESGKSLAGFIYFSYTFLDYPAIYVELLFISKAYRRRGLATDLMRNVEIIAAKEHYKIFSSTDHDNKPSLKMHKRLGYKQCGHIKNPSPNTQKELFFCKEALSLP